MKVLSMQITILRSDLCLGALFDLKLCVVEMCSKFEMPSIVPEILAQLFLKSGKLRAAEHQAGPKVVSAS